ncbi:MAG: S41 family peptidase [Candidatus Eremiobacteraeota bacterium]|nr:S41 family peptidase [Candidatus Eremiobacteraeota bacterium]
MRRFAPVFFFVLVLGSSGATAAPVPPPSLTMIESDVPIVMDRVEARFYRTVTYQAMLDAERQAIDAYLHSRGVTAELPAAPDPRGPATAHQDALRQLDFALAHYGGHVDSRTLAYVAIKGLAGGAHDQYTAYLTPDEYRAFNDVMAPERFAGIGTIIQTDPATEYISLFDVLPDGPAYLAGLQQDDVLVSIDGHDTKGMTIAQASKLLRGKAGTDVTLDVRRSDGEHSITIERGYVAPSTVVKHLLPNNVAYVAISVFGERTADEFDRALSELTKHGASAFVLDLRDNTGGYVDAALQVAAKFIATGPIVSTETRGGHFETIFGDNEAIASHPMVILANGNSASASEIAIGALQDSGVARVVGTRTFGKGVMQEVYALPDGAAVKVTYAKYFTPKNRDINHIGIAPDLSVQENDKPAFGTPAQDAQLRAALAMLSGAERLSSAP